MVTEEYKEYLKSDTWQRLRSKRLAIDEYSCQRCGTPYGLQVHHLAYPLELGTEDPYTDLITLCGPCHELVEHNKQMFRRDHKNAMMEKRNYELRTIYRIIRRMSCYDLSAIGVGTKDYCNIDVIKADFGPLVEDAGIEMMGYVSRVQNYFRDQRYRIILKMMDDGWTPRDICNRTKFSWNMVSKVFNKPETARTILKNAKETEYYEQTDEL
jgi:hypothetical protein